MLVFHRGGPHPVKPNAGFPGTPIAETRRRIEERSREIDSCTLSNAQARVPVPHELGRGATHLLYGQSASRAGRDAAAEQVPHHSPSLRFARSGSGFGMTHGGGKATPGSETAWDRVHAQPRAAVLHGNGSDYRFDRSHDLAGLYLLLTAGIPLHVVRWGIPCRAG